MRRIELKKIVGNLHCTCKKGVSLRKVSGKYESVDNSVRSCVHQIKMIVNSR